MKLKPCRPSDVMPVGLINRVNMLLCSAVICFNPMVSPATQCTDHIVEEEDSATLHCQCDLVLNEACDTLVIQWYDDVVIIGYCALGLFEIMPGYENLMDIDSSGQLIIYKVNLEDAGPFKCDWRNSSVTTTFVTNIVVYGE